MMDLNILLVLDMHVAVGYGSSTRHHVKCQKSPTCFRSCYAPSVTILLNLADGGADLRPGKRRVFFCDIRVNVLYNIIVAEVTTCTQICDIRNEATGKDCMKRCPGL